MASQPDLLPSDPAAVYMAEVERQCAADPLLSPLAAGILAGAMLNVAQDSRSFARLLGVEHALVLREVEQLSASGQLQVTRRDERTQRAFYALGAVPAAANDPD